MTTRQPTIKTWKNRLLPNEDILLTVNQQGILQPDELSGARYQVVFTGATFSGFMDRQNQQLFKTPTALCKARLHRAGATNEWRGPTHCLVKRGDRWMPLSQL